MSAESTTINQHTAKEMGGLTLKMRPLLVGELRARPPRKCTHHSSTSAAAVASSARTALAGAGTAISSQATEESKSFVCQVKTRRDPAHVRGEELFL